MFSFRDDIAFAAALVAAGAVFVVALTAEQAHETRQNEHDRLLYPNLLRCSGPIAIP
jgi:hypothetical protein